LFHVIIISISNVIKSKVLFDFIAKEVSQEKKSIQFYFFLVGQINIYKKALNHSIVINEMKVMT